MAFTRTITATWLTALGLVTLTVAATLWKRAAEVHRRRLADARDLIRLDSDKG